MKKPAPPAPFVFASATPEVEKPISFATILVDILTEILGNRGDDVSRAAFYVDREITPTERETVEATYRIAGLVAADEMLSTIFESRLGVSAPGDGRAFVPFRFIRVWPQMPELSYTVEGVVFRRDVGWHRVSTELARKVMGVRAPIPRGEQTLVFDTRLSRPFEPVVELDR